MNTFKKIILFISVFCITIPAHAMESGDGQKGYFDRALDFAKDNPGVLLSVGAALGVSFYVSKQMRNARAFYGSIWGPQIKQISVLDQFAGAEYGGGASCGYQALKNAIYISLSLCNKQPYDEVNDLAIVQQLFNKTEPMGLWRKLVLENTYSRAIKWKIDQTLYGFLVSQQNLETVAIPAEVQALEQKLQNRFRDKIRGYYQRVLGTEFSKEVLNRVLEALKEKPLQTREKVTLDRLMLISAIKKSELEIKPDIEGLEQFDFVSYAKSDEALATYLPEPKDGQEQDTQALEHTLEISKSSALANYNAKHLDNKFDSQGDWINENEIGLLIAHELQPARLLSNMPACFDGITVIDNVPLLDKGEGEYQEIREIAQRLKKSDNLLHAFVVGLMSGQPDSVSGSRHWITLVVHKHDGIIEYTTADSGSNASRTRDGIIWTLIKHLTLCA